MPENQLIAGRYRLLGPLGEGGMGVVWRARDEVLAREVAVKEVRSPVGLSSADERRLYQRLEREAWAAGRISHRGVVTVYDVVTDGGRPWIVMELVRGLALSDVLESDGPLTPQRAAQIGADVLTALGAAHEAGVLHRDVKPGNVLIANDGRVVLTDFGIAEVAGTSALTMTGELIGSPEYLAPERAQGHAPGPASDLWSLGVLLYTAVQGVSPFRREQALSTLRAVVDEEPSIPHLAGELAPVIEGLLRKNPDERLTAAAAHRLLRVVAAGGTGRPGGALPGSAVGTSDSSHASRADGSGAGTGASALPSTVSDAPAAGPGGAADSGQPRRAVAVLAAGIALLLLVIAVLVWALIDDARERAASDGERPGATSRTSAPGGGVQESSRTPSTATTPATDTPSPQRSRTTSASASAGSPRPQRVEVAVWAVRDDYAGSCAPPPDEAPAFRAAVAVQRAPTVVEYRWMTRSGRTSATDWQSLRFSEDGPLERLLDHTEVTHRPQEMHRDRLRVEVRQPVQVRSAWVSFSVDCAPETPAGGASSPSGTSGVTAGAIVGVSRWR
ncbi:serine/threonine-protein kinase [Streptomyces sp. NBC_00690]|uniref:serine/threonine-protein kinase n=1 Tax=Streptomyces sp. NBC_00690 TaxID=2975808 RepID=UPI002E2C76F5|nr:serine/threonine-protein kinase [Streptomyces sp. NBC_00690]